MHELGLYSQHQEKLTSSAVSGEVAHARGYRTIDTKTRLEALGFPQYQQRTPGLLIPQYDPRGELAGYQYRPDHPREIDGRIVKYESLEGSEPVLDVSPLRREWLRSRETLWITEGSLKGDALTSAGLPAIALSGVAAWQSGGMALAGFSDIRLRGRPVVIAFDSDVMTKPAVRGQLDKLAGYLRGQGAAVRFCLLPPDTHGGKQGVDDFLAAGHSTAELTALVVGEIAGVTAAGSRVPVRDPAMFHGALGDIVRVIAPFTEADPAGILASLLTFASVLVGTGPHVLIGAIRHPMLIWSLLLGSTGTGRKGEATSSAQQILDRAESLNASSVSASGLSSGEGVIERIRDPKEIPAPKGQPPTFIGTDDKRLLVTETEFSAVMARSRREGSTLSAVLRQAWEGRRLSVLNRSELVASSSHVGVVGHITPKEFRKRLAELDMAGGTYNRFLPIWVDRSKALPLPPQMPPDILQELADRFAQAIKVARDINGIYLGTEAETVWSDHIYGDLSGDDREDTAASEFTRRLLPYCRRISALYAALDGRCMVTVDDLTAAAALCRYSRETAAYVLGDAKSDPRVDRIRRAVMEADDGLTRTGIRDLFGRNLRAELLTELLADATADGAIEAVEDRDTGGRPRTTYRSTVHAETRGYAERNE